VLEPGSRPASRRLQAIRDQLAASAKAAVIAPCAAPRCPRLADPRDWCHFTWRLGLGPIGQAIANAAHRRWQEVHASWLVLSGTVERPALIRPARLLELRAADKAKAVARVCTDTGELALTALRRHREAYEKLTTTAPGALVDLGGSELELHGDGLRMVTPNALRVLAPF
jgi:ribosomal protein RSM22 (predicted rRNA methylase)